MRNSVRIVMLVLWILVIFILTGFPSLRTPNIKDVPFDKLYHFIIFFVLGILEYRVLRNISFFILGCCVAIVAELQQIIIPGREFEIIDIGAGVLGLIVAYVIFNRRRILRGAIPKT